MFNESLFRPTWTFLYDFREKPPADWLPQLLAWLERPWRDYGPNRSNHIIRYAAAWLGHAFPLAELTPVIAQLADDAIWRDFAALLVQEMVVHGEKLDADPLIGAFWNALRERQHPLAFLPLVRTPLERKIRLETYPDDVGGNWGFLGPEQSSYWCRCSYRSPVAQGRAGGREAGLTPISGRAYQHCLDDHLDIPFLLGRDYQTAEAHSFEASVLSATSSWCLHSNGEAEAGAFQVTEFRPELMPELLFAMDLKFLENPKHFLPGWLLDEEREEKGLEPAEVWCWEDSAGEIMERLFAAAFMGGFFGETNFGAIARLQAFETMSALAGLSPEVPFADGLNQIERTTWYGFEAETPRFHEIITDIAILAVRTDYQSVAVLCASDTD
jgi:hypothetical protein